MNVCFSAWGPSLKFQRKPTHPKRKRLSFSVGGPRGQKKQLFYKASTTKAKPSQLPTHSHSHTYTHLLQSISRSHNPRAPIYPTCFPHISLVCFLIYGVNSSFWTSKTDLNVFENKKGVVLDGFAFGAFGTCKKS